MNFAAQKSVYDRDISAIEPEMPGVHYLPPSLTPYACSLTPAADSLNGTEMGYEQVFDFIMVVRRSVYPTGITVPKVNDLINVVDMLGTTIEVSIKSREISQDGVSITYGLKASN